MINCFCITVRGDSRSMSITREKPILMRKVNSLCYSRITVILNDTIHLTRERLVLKWFIALACFAVITVFTRFVCNDFPEINLNPGVAPWSLILRLHLRVTIEFNRRWLFYCLSTTYPVEKKFEIIIINLSNKKNLTK